MKTMKKLLHLIVLGLLLSSYNASAQVVEEVTITRETFGNTSWDINDARVSPDWFPDGFARVSDSATHFKAFQVNTFTSLNGSIRGGSDNSVRINSYDDPTLTLTKPENWRDPAGIHHMHMGIRNGNAWMGSWDTTYFQGINIAGYEIAAIEFGFARARTHGSNDLRWISVHYRVDGGAWLELDTTLYAPPVTAAINTWFYIQAPIFIDNAQTLDIRFSAMRADEQIYIDDLTVRGFPTTFVPVATLAVTSPAETVGVGSTLQMSGDALPADATNKAVVWSVDAPAVATISATGLLTGVSEGTVVVTARTSSVPTVTTTKTITVTAAAPPVGVPSVGSAFTLYPVPVESQLFISSNVAVERIEVFSIDGRVLVSKVLAGGNSVDLSGLRTGTYIARITKVNGEVVTRSILKK